MKGNCSDDSFLPADFKSFSQRILTKTGNLIPIIHTLTNPQFLYALGQEPAIKPTEVIPEANAAV